MNPNKNIKVITIAAIAQDAALGRDGVLPWSCPIDMRRFIDLTRDKLVVMGSKTAASLKKPLSNRVNVVLSKSGFKKPGFITVSDLDSLWDLCDKYQYTEVWCIGGGEIYKLFLPMTDVLHLTEINIPIPDADVFFPLDMIESWQGVVCLECADPLVNFYVFTPDPIRTQQYGNAHDGIVIPTQPEILRSDAAYVTNMEQVGVVTLRGSKGDLVNRYVDGTEEIIKKLPDKLIVEPGTVLKR